MKKYKILFFIIISFLLLLIIYNFNLYFSTANEDKPNKIFVSGTIKNQSGHTLKNVKVSFTNKDNPSASPIEVETDDNGYYNTQVDPGKYVVKYNYPVSCETKNMSMKKYELFDKNLELAFIYNSNETDGKEQFFYSKIATDSSEVRFIENKFENNSQLSEKIKTLQKNSSNEKSIHNPGIEGWENVSIIISNETQSKIIQYIETAVQHNTDYNFVICKPASTAAEIIKKIYDELNMASTDVQDIYDTSDKDYSQTKEIDIQSTSMIDLIVEETTTDEGNLTEDSSYPNFIKGNLYKQKDDGEYESINSNVKVKLINVNTNKFKTKTVNDGKFNFAYPGGGYYRIEYEYDYNDINGQYYQAANKEKKVGNTTGPEQNCLNSDNLEQIKNKFKSELGDSNFMDYNFEYNRIENNKSEWKIIAKSDEFYIPYKSGSYNPTNHTFYAGAKLKKRKQFKLHIDEKINMFKIVLSNGQVFKQYKQGDSDALANAIDLFNITLDPNIGYGAQLLVEYKITVKNEGDINCNGIKILNRIENLDFDKDQTMLTNKNFKNYDKYKWKEKTKEEAAQMLVGGIDTAEPTKYLAIEDPYVTISAHNKKDYLLTLTMPLDGDECSFRNSIEIVGYRNNEIRRNYAVSSTIPMDTGNSNSNESDYSIAEEIAVLPPTGNKIKSITLLITFSICCLIILFKHRKRNYINKKGRN